MLVYYWWLWKQKIPILVQIQEVKGGLHPRCMIIRALLEPLGDISVINELYYGPTHLVSDLAVVD